MADVITRFKLETTQYDSKLRDAAKGLKEFTHQAQLGGKNFTDFSQKAVESARALGTVASGAMNTKEKVRDLVGAYNEAAKAYNSLSEAQQQHDFGKNLAASLETLKGRITEAKQELYGMNEAVEEAGKKTGSLFGEGGLTGMMQVFGGNLLAEGVSKLTSELAGSVQESIELARQGEGIRMAFERLNNPGLLDKLKAATHGTVSEIELMKQAVKFENFKLPVEDLANYLAFAQQKAKDTGESIDFLVTSIVNGLGRQSKQILDNLGISAAELTSRMNEGATMTQAVSDIIREEMAKAGDYVETAADRAARAAADTKNKMEDLGRSAMPVAEEFTTAWNEIKNGAMTIVLPVLKTLADSIRDIREILSGEWSFDAKISKMPDIGSNIDDNGNFIRKPSNGNWAGFNAQTGQYNDAVTAIQDIVVTGNAPAKKKGRSGRRSGSAKGSSTFNPDSIAFKAMDGVKVDPDKYFQSVWKEIGEAGRKQIAEMTDKQTFDLGKDISTDWVVNSKGQLVNKKQGKGKDSEGGFIKGIDNVNDTLSNVGGSINNIFGSLQQMGIEIPQGIASVLGALNIITSILTFIQSVVAIKSIIPGLAGGGLVPHAAGGYMVPGNYYSGDVTPIMANAGELILNKSQQNNIASQLTQAGGGGRLVAKLRGRDILISLERELSETGKGQLATWR